MLTKSHQVTSHRVNAEEFYFNPMGEVYYVRNNGSDSNDGKSADRAFLTLAYAVHDIAGDWDMIVVLPSTDTSTYLETDIPIAVTQTGLKIIGGQPSRYTWGIPNIHTHAATTLMTIDAGSVEIANLSFHHVGAAITLQIGQTAVAWRSYIHDCHFGGNNTSTYGVDMGCLMDAPFTVVENCYFQGYAEAAIRSNAFYSVVKDCDFEVYTAKYGILHSPTGGGRPGTRLIDNRFSTTDSSNAVGIEVSGTPTVGMFYVDGNHFVNFANEAHCISKGTILGYNGMNYFGGTVMTVNT